MKSIYRQILLLVIFLLVKALILPAGLLSITTGATAQISESVSVDITRSVGPPPLQTTDDPDWKLVSKSDKKPESWFPAKPTWLPGSVSASSYGHRYQTSTTIGGGLSTTTFKTPPGNIIVRLPDELVAGDAFSGTVSFEPNGNTAPEHEEAVKEASGYLIEMENEQSRVGAQKFNPFEREIPATGPRATPLILKDSKGNELARAHIPVSSDQVVSQTEFQFPEVGQQGHPIEVAGTFDGDFSNSGLQLGGEKAPLLAESPRKMVAYNNSNKYGPTQLVAKEKDKSGTSIFRNIGVQLSAPKLNLIAGEKTKLTVNVVGLKGIKKSQVRLVVENKSPGVITVGGGNLQKITIKPKKVKNGVYTLERSLTSVKSGVFSVIGTVEPIGKNRSPDYVSVTLKAFPQIQQVRPLESAIIQVKVQYFGKTKTGHLRQRLENEDWQFSLAAQSTGWLSKPFLIQKKNTEGIDPRIKSGFGNFLKQGFGAISSKDAVLYTAPAEPGIYTIRVVNQTLTKEISIEVTNSAPSSKNSQQRNFDGEEKSSDPYFGIVEHYAPYIAQETWFNPNADFIARFDYDGNFKGDDNWESLRSGSSQAFVYYAVMETETHWFLIYNFFHPRDYSDVCVVGTCHENDNEGLILSVRKNESKFGSLEVMETLAHNNIYSFTNEPRIKKRVHDIDGRLDLFEGVRPIIFIEAGGHGVFGSSARQSLFSAKTMEFKNTGITYVYKDSAERPEHPNHRNVGYALLPIFDEWWSRGNQNTDEPNETFEKFYSYKPYGNRPGTNQAFISGAFRGRTASDNMAKPFWAWHDILTKQKKILNTGQWALDPAYAISRNLKFPKELPVSTRYTFNPYLKREQIAK